MNTVIAIFFLTGSTVILLAAVGVVKFKNTLLRLHAAAKSASFGVILLTLGAAVHFVSSGDWILLVTLIVVVVLVFIKTPVAGQAIARAAYFLEDSEMWKSLELDEWHGKDKSPQPAGEKERGA
ncbi:MAG: monovalent cation/H(+) antiporter subunit G [Acidobacteriota bacterium]|nr:monovalent cation/H(+) antiporter subunit G [Acidobacteriota bacterium]